MTPKEKALMILEGSMGDDLYRAEHAFRGLSAEVMAEEYGLSGKTRAQILTEYRQDAAERMAAIEWVRNAK